MAEYSKRFTQTEYNAIVSSLDVAFDVFAQTSENPEAALRDFVENHYFKIWRAMIVDNPLPVGRETGFNSI